MISETAYMDQVRNCVKFNKKFNAERRRQQSFFDQQTGIAQRPSEHLIRHAADRYNPIKPTEVSLQRTHTSASHISLRVSTVLQIPIYQLLVWITSKAPSSGYQVQGE